MGVAAEKGLVSPGNQLNLMPRIRELNFDSVRKMMSTIHQLDHTVDGAQRVSFTKGAPKEVLERCSYILDGEKVRPITEEDKKKAMDQNDRYARDGLRVLAMAYRLLKKDSDIPLALSAYTPEIIEKEMVFVGLEAMQDPPREGIREAIAQCHRAGIKVIMVTGDYGLTALAIAKKIGIVHSDKEIAVITGSELAKMTDDELKEKLKGEVLFARMAPEQKYRVVTCLQELGEIVAVTGDGVLSPRNFLVPIGTSFGDTIHAAGGLLDGVKKVISGGPMMGFAQKNLDAPVLKGTNAILCLKHGNETPENPTCIRCARCVSVCPMHLQPLYLYRYTKLGRLPQLDKFHLMDCIECGCCSYICPGRLPLVQTIREGKKLWKEANAK